MLNFSYSKIIQRMLPLLCIVFQAYTLKAWLDSVLYCPIKIYLKQTIETYTESLNYSTNLYISKIFFFIIII